ncbi:hypothetical protein Tco_0374384 [Tanacetum coccineum]
MAIKTEKNAASGSTVIDENRGRDDLRQNLKKRGTSKDVVASLDQRVTGVETSMAELKNHVKGLEGLDSDFTSMREDFRVALNTLSGDLKRKIHDLRDSFMGEITKIREDFGVEIDVPKPSPFVEKQEARAVEDFLWGMEQYLEGVNVVDVVSMIKMATRYLKDTAALWYMDVLGHEDWRGAVADINEDGFCVLSKVYVRTTLEAKKTWWLRLGAGVYDSWKLQGDVKELWDELAKLGLGLRFCLVLMVPRLNLVPKDVMWPLGSQVGASCTQGTVSSIPIVGSISPEGFLSLILLLVVVIATVVVTNCVSLLALLTYGSWSFLGLELGLFVFAIVAACASRAMATLLATSFLMAA